MIKMTGKFLIKRIYFEGNRAKIELFHANQLYSGYIYCEEKKNRTVTLQ